MSPARAAAHHRQEPTCADDKCCCVVLQHSYNIVDLVLFARMVYVCGQNILLYHNCAVVQSPNLTLVWVSAMSGTLLPLTSFTIDTHEFCKKLSKPEAVLMTTYAAFCIACFVAGPDWFDVFGIFQFYPMPFHYMWRAYLLAFGFSLWYLFTFRCIRILWNRYQHP